VTATCRRLAGQPGNQATAGGRVHSHAGMTSRHSVTQRHGENPAATWPHSSEVARFRKRRGRRWPK
jgi:hypothetical protein